MTLARRSPHITITTFALSALLGGCAGDSNDQSDVDEIASALEQENGGLDTADEAPLFGAEDEFTAADIEAETAFDDPMESTPGVVETMNAPAAVFYGASIVWGQMPPDPDQQEWRDWSGTLSVNRGAVLVRRVLAFEDDTDAVAPRTDGMSVSFTSKTRPHVDGLRLAIIDPTPESADPLVLSYAPAGASTAPAFSIPMADLVAGPVTHEVDDIGNRVVAMAFREPADPCAHGMLRGRWHKVAEGRGKLIGQVADSDGELIGHVRGIYGRRASGEHVFFGKYIDLDGHFRGLFRGAAQDGHFVGRWIERGDHDRGVLAGEYRESIPGPETGGNFLGRWAETSCNLALDR